MRKSLFLLSAFAGLSSMLDGEVIHYQTISTNGWSVGEIFLVGNIQNKEVPLDNLTIQGFSGGLGKSARGPGGVDRSPGVLQVIPEPVLLIGVGLAAIGVLRLRQRRTSGRHIAKERRSLERLHGFRSLQMGTRRGGYQKSKASMP
jgi:hypothetical protein